MRWLGSAFAFLPQLSTHVVDSCGRILRVKFLMEGSEIRQRCGASALQRVALMSLKLPESAEAVLVAACFRGLKVRRLTRRVLRLFYLRFAREDLRCNRL